MQGDLVGLCPPTQPIVNQKETYLNQSVMYTSPLCFSDCEELLEVKFNIMFDMKAKGDRVALGRAPYFHAAEPSLNPRAGG